MEQNNLRAADSGIGRQEPLERTVHLAERTGGILNPPFYYALFLSAPQRQQRKDFHQNVTTLKQTARCEDKQPPETLRNIETHAHTTWACVPGGIEAVVGAHSVMSEELPSVSAVRSGICQKETTQ